MDTLSDRCIDFAGICETWLTDMNNPVTAAIKSYGYQIQHDYRDDRRGGGTAIIYKSCYSASVFRTHSEYKTFEYTAASFKTHTTMKVLFVIMYRPGQICSLFIEELDSFLSETLSKFDSLVLAGDLNIHFDQLSNNLCYQSFNLLQSYALNREVFEATHIGGGSLDQIFTLSLNNTLKCSVSVDNSGLLESDHYPVYCTLTLNFEKKYHKEIHYRKIADIDKEVFLSDIVNLLDSVDYTSGDFKEAITNLSISAGNILDSHAPMISKRVTVVNSAPWFDKEYRDLRKLRRKSERIWRKTKTEGDLVKYKDMCRTCSSLAIQKKKKYFGNLFDRANGNPKTLYQIVNKELDRNQTKRLPDFLENEYELATEFNKFFINKIEKIRNGMGTEQQFPTPDIEFDKKSLLYEFEPTNLEEIRSIINESGVKCSPADLLPHQLFKSNLHVLLPTLVDLINLSLKTGNVDGVKLADIVPLLKDESLDHNLLLKNFRPVSNLTFIGKLIERVVLKRLNNHLTRNNLHCPEQSAYKQHHSTETLLVRIWNDLLIATDERKATVVMLLDLSAAFDTVDHNLLLRILRNEIGLRGNVLKWFESFLTGRSQRIRLGNTISDEICIMFGVPQGSVLGPVLFNIYIRSIYGYVRSLGFSIHGYADDHQVCKAFLVSSQSTVLTYDIDKCFSKIKLWVSQYYLQMNDSKTNIIVFGSSKILNQVHINGVNLMSGANIRFISTVKNLGIYMDAHLTLSKQVVELKKKSFKMIRNICKIRFLLSPAQLKIIVNSLVVSCLDYCNGIYYGISEKLLRQLQLIQNAAAKAVTGKYKYDHLDNDLKELHWLDVRKRILFKIGLLAYKSINGMAPKYLQDLFRYSHHGHNLKLIVPTTNSNYGEKSFSVIGPRLFNKLPLSVSTSKNADEFKNKLKTYLFKLSSEEVKNLSK